MLFSDNEDEQGRLSGFLTLRIGSFATLSTRLGAVDFPRVCGPPPPLIHPLSLLLSAYVCPESLSACRLATSPAPDPYPHACQLMHHAYLSPW